VTSTETTNTRRRIQLTFRIGPNDQDLNTILDKVLPYERGRYVREAIRFYDGYAVSMRRLSQRVDGLAARRVSPN